MTGTRQQRRRAGAPSEVAGQHYEPAESPRTPTLAEARALAHPLRVRILRLCLDRAMTNRELAAALDEHPGTVLHHVRTLLNTGFIRQETTRPGPRGTTEKPYRATGKSWWLEHAMDAGEGAVRQAVLKAVAAEIDEAGPDAVIEGARMAMRLRPEQLKFVLGLVRSLIEECEATDSSDGDPYAMLLLFHRRRSS